MSNMLEQVLEIYIKEETIESSTLKVRSTWRDRSNLRRHLLEQHQKSRFEDFGEIYNFIINSKEFNKEFQRIIQNTLLQMKKQVRPYFTEGNEAYTKMKEEIESNYIGKVVAIDCQKRKVVGSGNTIIEAYKEAITKSAKKKFYFKRVGEDSLFDLPY